MEQIVAQKKKRVRTKYNRQYYAEHLEHRREAIRKSSARRREQNRELVNRYHRLWYANHKDSSREYQNKYREQHSREYKAYQNKWREENIETVRGYTRTRRAKRISVTGEHFSTKQFDELCNNYGNKCLCCGVTDRLLTPDHVIPLGPPNSDSISNIQPLCGSCNSKKHTKEIDYRQGT